MSSVLFHRGARKDFAEAYRWYWERSPASAARFDEALNEAIVRIAAAFESLPRLNSRERYCRLRPFPYLLVVRRREDSLVVVAIAHGKRRVYWRSRR